MVFAPLGAGLCAHRNPPIKVGETGTALIGLFMVGGPRRDASWARVRLHGVLKNVDDVRTKMPPYRGMIAEAVISSANLTGCLFFFFFDQQRNGGDFSSTLSW